MTASLDSILSGGEAASEQDQTNATASQVEAGGESQAEQANDSATANAGESQTEAERESLRGSAAQLAARDKAHAEALATREKEITDEWRRRMASEVPRQTERAIQQYIESQKAQQPQDMWAHPNGPEAWAKEQITNALKEKEVADNQSRDREFLEDAVDDLGAEKVNAAHAYLIEKLNANDPVAVAKMQELGTARKRYHKLVKWHEKELARLEIGDDPTAYKARLEAEIRERLQSELNGGNGQPAQQRQSVVTPSNFAGARNVGVRSGPAWAGPAPISDIFNRARAPE